MIIGIDEVGRGAWAGPMVIAGAAMVKNVDFELGEGKNGKFWMLGDILIGDSKKISQQRREISAKWVEENMKSFVVEVSCEVINKSGIRAGWDSGVIDVVKYFEDAGMGRLEIVVDGNQVPRDLVSKNIRAEVKGDQKVFEIAAASILAKVYRDKLMKELANVYGNYGWERNVGYGTKGHREGVEKYGICDQHRLLWVRNVLNLVKF